MWAIGFLTLVMPWLVVRGVEEPFLAPKLLAWLGGSWGLILSVWFGKMRQPICFSRPLVWFGSWVVLSAFLGFYIPYLLRPIGTSISVYGDRWLATVYVLTALGTWYALQAYLCVRPFVARITAWCCWTACAMAVYQGLQALGLDQFYTQDMQQAKTIGYVYRPYAGLGNIQFVAITQALTLPLFFLFRSWRYLLMLTIVLCAIAFSGVKLAQVAAVVSLVAYAFARLWHRVPKRRLLLGLAVAVLIGTALPWCWRQLRYDERWTVWSEVVYQWRQPNIQGRPMSLTGWGLQSFPERFWVTLEHLRPETLTKVNMAGFRYDNAHSDFLQGLYELGVVGGVLLLAVGTSVLIRGWLMASTPVGAAWWASLVTLLGLSVLYFPWHMASMAWLGSLIVAMNLRQPEQLT